MATSHSFPGCVFKSNALMGLEATVRLRVGQQFQDGGQTVELLLHVLWQLLVLLIPANRTASAILSAPQEEKKAKSDIVLSDSAVWRRVSDGGNSGLHHQLRPVVELDPHLSARQLVGRKRSSSITNSSANPRLGHRYSPETPTQRWAQKWTWWLSPRSEPRGSFSYSH